MLIITGILIEKYGINKDSQIENIFGYSMIGLGSLNLIIDRIKKVKNV